MNWSHGRRSEKRTEEPGKKRTEKCRMSNRSLRRAQPCRMSKGGFAALCLFIKSIEFLPSTFDIRYSAVRFFTGYTGCHKYVPLSAPAFTYLISAVVMCQLSNIGKLF